ncbi:hypothetical protein Efla_006805 [Eimeria flavescens]
MSTAQAMEDSSKVDKGILESREPECDSLVTPLGTGISSQVTSATSRAKAVVMRRPLGMGNDRMSCMLDGKVFLASRSAHGEDWGLPGIEQRVVSLLDGRNARSESADEERMDNLRIQQRFWDQERI